MPVTPAEKGKNRWGCWIISSLLLLIMLIVAAVPVVWFSRAVDDLRTTAAELRTLPDLDPSASMAVQGASLVQKLDRQVEQLRKLTTFVYPALNAASHLPYAGERAGQVKPLLEYTAHVTRAASIMAGLVEPALSSDDTVDLNKRAYSLILVAQGPAMNAAVELEQARKQRRFLNPAALPASISEDLQDVDKAAALLKQAVDAILVAPALMGSESPQTYLILLQNRDELRPSGGFITDFGLLRIQQGHITLLDFKDSTQISDWTARRVEPPTPIRDIMMAPYLVARDANWSPDFPTAARSTKELYYLSTEIETDGVIALDQGAVVEMLRLFGPVTVDGITIDHTGIEQYMIDQKMEALAAGESLTRKAFIGHLAAALLEPALDDHSPDRLIELVRTLHTQIESGHLNLFFENIRCSDDAGTP
jgi:hypothetical protein